MSENSSGSRSSVSEGSDGSMGFGAELDAELDAVSEDEDAFSPTGPSAFEAADEDSEEAPEEPPPLTGSKRPAETELNPADFVTPRPTRPVTPHPGFIWGMCIACGHQEDAIPDPGCCGTKPDLDPADDSSSASQPDEAGGGQQYQVLPDLGGIRMHSSEVNRYRKRKMGQLKRDGKLTLVLDLDHTVLNSSQFRSITPEQHELLVKLLHAEHHECPNGPHDCEALLHHNPVIGMWTKLRPYIREFLQHMQQFYQLYIYTMGNRGYANAMARLLDADQSLFGNRIISRDDLKGKTKNLQNVLSDERSLLILDDSTSVWPDHAKNLLVAPRYHFFPQSSADFGVASPSLLTSHRDEDNCSGWLPAVEEPLRRVHAAFFEADEESKPDVRVLLAQERAQVLAGVRVLFSGVVDSKMKDPRRQCPHWRIAEELGAVVEEKTSGAVTHVVAIMRGQHKTDKLRWAAQQQGVQTVGVAWLHACHQMWARVDEAQCPVLAADASCGQPEDPELILRVAGGSAASQEPVGAEPEGAGLEGPAGRED